MVSNKFTLKKQNLIKFSPVELLELKNLEAGNDAKPFCYKKKTYKKFNDKKYRQINSILF
jgi:hypothetical protein